MAQLLVADLLEQGDQLGIRLIGGPSAAVPIERVEVAELNAFARLLAGTLVIVSGQNAPAPYLIDVAIRQASALRLAGIILPPSFTLTETAGVLAARGEVPLLIADGPHGTDLAVSIDRVLSGGAAESMIRAAYAIEQASEAASDPARSPEEILAVAGAALGAALDMEEDPGASWSDARSVFIGEVPIGRLRTDADDPAAEVALPVIASFVSRVLQRNVRERFAPRQSRAELIVELVLAEAARVDAFIAPAARLGLPLQLTHVAALLRPRHRLDPELRAPHAVVPAVRLFAMQLFEEQPEMWHIAHIQDDLLLVSTEEDGAGDHQRRLRELAITVQHYAASLAGEEWSYTLGLGTPQSGAAGLRQSAAEARVAADSAIAAGRLGGIETTDVTGLRRVLLDFYASPTSRNLLGDVLHPLDTLGPERSMTAVRTLVAYLGTQNSLAQAARRLVLHPNAVGYRMRWIKEALDLDLDDPDVRFAVELACRVRLLGEGE